MVETEEKVNEQQLESSEANIEKALEELEILEQDERDKTKEILKEKQRIMAENDFNKNVASEENILKIDNDILELKKKKGNFEKIKKLSSVKRQLIDINSFQSMRKEKYRELYILNNKATSNSMKNHRAMTLKQVSDKLNKTKKYRFLHPKNILPILYSRMPEGRRHYALIFTDCFFEFIMSNKIRNNAIFITQTINNIYKLKHEDYDYEFVDTIIKYVEEEIIRE